MDLIEPQINTDEHRFSGSVSAFMLAPIVRVIVEPGLLNNTLWDERELTKSYSECVIFPETCVLTDHLLELAEGIIEDLRFFN